MGLGKVWERIVYQKSLIDMIMEGYLCDLWAVRVSLQVNLDQVHTRGGDFVESELESALLNADAPGHVVAAYQEHAVGRKGLVFTPTVRVAHEMAQAYRGAGISVQALGGKTAFDERRDILHRLRAGETRVVCNCAVLTEGFGGL